MLNKLIIPKKQIYFYLDQQERQIGPHVNQQVSFLENSKRWGDVVTSILHQYVGRYNSSIPVSAEWKSVLEKQQG